MSLELPTSLTPSKVSAFTTCAMAFRFSQIDRLPEPPSPHAAKGTLVHRVLELLHWHQPQGKRTLETALTYLPRAVSEVLDGPEYIDLRLSDNERGEFVDDAQVLIANAFALEDPNDARILGVELRLEVTIGTLKLRGIIDRLEIAPDGALVVTDYKTGRAPGQLYEQTKLGGVHFYALLCEEVIGRRPDRVQLLHLREPIAIIAEPSEQSTRGQSRRASAIWTAVEKACEREDFRPRPSKLCDWCNFKEFCPAFGGNPGTIPVAAATA